MALKMIEDAEASGKLKQGGTVVEGTSGKYRNGFGSCLSSKGVQVNSCHDR